MSSNAPPSRGTTLNKCHWRHRLLRVPGDLTSRPRADFAILTIVPEAFEAACEMLGLTHREDPEEDDHIYYSGFVQARDGSGEHFVVCGCPLERGNIAATAFTSTMLTTWRPRRLLLADIGGGVFGRDNLELGDVVAHETIHYYEFEKRLPTGRSLRYSTGSPSAQRLRALARDAQYSAPWHLDITAPRPPDSLGAPGSEGDGENTAVGRDRPELTLGEIAVGEKLLGDPEDELLAEILGTFDKAKAVDMESAGAAHAIWATPGGFHTDFLVLRGISDFANRKGNQDTRDLWKPYAAQAAVAAAKAIIESERAVPAEHPPESDLPAEFRSDIEKLIAHSRANIERLSSFSSVPGDDGEPIKLNRGAPKALQDTLDGGPVILTGDPGAGKSACFYDLAISAMETHDVVVLAADSLDAHSLGQLRDELGLEHEVVDVLRNWPGTERGYLLVDALDAARGERTQKALLDLIDSATRNAERWAVAASIRRFDLRYNLDLQAMFTRAGPEPSPEFQLQEFAQIRHFNVPLLSVAELRQLELLAPRLGATLAAATDELRELVRTPFNLRLLADLVSLDVGTAELEPITTQLQLLDKYWQHRVLRGTGGDAMEAVLRTACDRMVVSRSMGIDRSTLQTNSSSSESLAELLSRRVLTERENAGGVEREVITFSHHVLFDYAVSRLLFRGVESTIVEKTLDAPELLLIVRPSYDMHFRHVWASAPGRAAFWSLVITFAVSEEMPEIGKIIGPGVAAVQMRCHADFEPLIQALQVETQRRSAAESVLRHLVGARLFNGKSGGAIPDDRRGVWCKFVRALSNDLRSETAYPLATLLQELCMQPERLSDDQLRDVGIGVRNLSKWMQDCESQDGRLRRFAIEGIVRTFASDPVQSEQLLRDSLTEQRLQSVGFVELPQLADEISSIIDLNPVLARDIYSAAFGFKERSDEPTQLVSGIMNINSTRRQDYERAHTALIDAFPELLKRAPGEAIDALGAIQRAKAKGLRDS